MACIITHTSSTANQVSFLFIIKLNYDPLPFTVKLSLILERLEFGPRFHLPTNFAELFLKFTSARLFIECPWESY